MEIFGRGMGPLLKYPFTQKKTHKSIHKCQRNRVTYTLRNTDKLSTSFSKSVIEHPDQNQFTKVLNPTENRARNFLIERPHFQPLGQRGRRILNKCFGHHRLLYRILTSDDVAVKRLPIIKKKN